VLETEETETVINIGFAGCFREFGVLKPILITQPMTQSKEEQDI
jgi:hypothetical protein